MRKYYMPNNSDGLFGAWLNNQLIDNAISIADLSRELSITRESISRHINKKMCPSISALKKYADYFGVDWFELYDMVLDDYRDVTVT